MSEQPPKDENEPNSQTVGADSLFLGDMGATILLHLAADPADPVDQIVVGRVDDVDFTVKDPLLSRQHFVLSRDANGWHIRDLGSKNGTAKNGVRLDDQPHPVAHGDTLTAGSSCFQVVIHDSDE